MNKEEVLKKAQNSTRNKLDEMEMDILLRGNHIGLTAGVIVCLIIMVIKIYFDQPYQDVYSINCSIICAQYAYKWIRQREKFSLFCALAGGFSAVLLFILYLTEFI